MRASYAIGLDPRNADAFEARGELRYLRLTLKLVDGNDQKLAQLDSAEQDLKRSVSINPGQATAHAVLTRLYYSPLRPNIPQAGVEALLAYQNDAFLRDADYILSRLFWTTHDNEQFPEANRWCEIGRERFPKDPFFVECHLWMMTTRNGDNGDTKPEHAWKLYEQYRQLLPPRDSAFNSRLGQIIVAGALARAQLADSARNVLKRVPPMPGDDGLELLGYQAVVRVILGDNDEAVRLLALYAQGKPDHLKGFATGNGWWWRDLQSNPKFKALIAGAR